LLSFDDSQELYINILSSATLSKEVDIVRP